MKRFSLALGAASLLVLGAGCSTTMTANVNTQAPSPSASQTASSVPKYPGATTVSQDTAADGTVTLVLHSTDGLDKTDAWYDDQFTTNGWEDVGSNLSSNLLVERTVKKGDKQLGLKIEWDDQGDGSTITLTYKK